LAILSDKLAISTGRNHPCFAAPLAAPFQIDPLCEIRGTYRLGIAGKFRTKSPCESARRLTPLFVYGYDACVCPSRR
jgi:hypothetical protein